MSTDLRKARELFLHAVGKLPPEQWEGYIAEACGVDSDLAQQVGGLLQVHREAGSFLDAPAPGLDVTPNQPLFECPGTQIGPYKLLQQIGEGGMGVVYMAEQTEPIARRVALKIIKPGMDTRQVIARFEAERQALAMMDHVNIARVLDAGTTEAGRPYFVMELVHGVPITKYCDDNCLTPRQRLELFVPVCQAIQHAHQKGIIHRDIKPSNVMVTLYDGQPVPKVIDFGVAKAIEQKLTERTLFTQYGTMVGTLEYMSPEQAEMSALGVDTRSDIYSLGVLLYELLTGSTPLSSERMKEIAYAEILRLIKEEEPPKPSTRLSDSGEALASISANRHMEPAKLTKLVRGELDWIVMKCLEKDRNRRYETTIGLAADVQRYLNDDPVLACPPSAGYRLRKFARRNRAILTTVALVMAALITGAGVASWQAVRATKARVLAQERLKNETKAREEATANLQKARDAGDQFFSHISESTILDEPGLQPLRQQLLETAVAYYEGLIPQSGNDPKVQVDVVLARLRQAQVYYQVGVFDQYAATLDEAIELVEKLIHENPQASELHLRLAGFWHGGRGLADQGPWDSPQALPTLRRAIDCWERLTKRYPEAIAFQCDLSKFYDVLGTLEGRVGRMDERLRIRQKVCELRENIVRATPGVYENLAELAHAYINLGLALQDTDAEEAERLLRQAVAIQKDAPNVSSYQQFRARHHKDLGRFLRDHGRPEEALPFWLEAISINEKLAKQFPHVTMYRARMEQLKREAENLRRNLGQISEQPPAERPAQQQALALLKGLIAEGDAYRAAKEPQKAEHSYRMAITQFKELPPEVSELAGCRESLLRAYVRLGDLFLVNEPPEGAEQAYREALEVAEKLASDFPAVPEYRSRLAQRRLTLGQLYSRVGRAQEAEQAYRQAIDLRAALTAEFPQAETHWYNLGLVLAQLGQWDQAVAGYTKAIELKPDYWEAWTHRGWAHTNLRQWDRSVADHTKAIELKPDRGMAWHGRGYAHANLGKWDKSVADYTTAIELKPDIWDAWRGRGVAHANLGQWDKAVADQTKALELMPKNWHSWWRRGQAYSALEQWDQAAADLAKAAELAPQQAEPWCQLGLVQSMLGQHAQAVASQTKAIELNNSADAWHNRGFQYANLGQWDKAIADQTKAAELSPTDWRIWWRRGRAYTALKQWDQAILDYAKAIELGATEADVWLSKAAAHARLDQPDQAIAALEEANRLQPDTAQFELASALAQAKQWDRSAAVYAAALQRPGNSSWPGPWYEAIRSDEVFTRLTALQPADRLPWMMRARLHVLQRDWKRAAADYARVKESLTSGDEALEYASLLLLLNDRPGYEQFCKPWADRVGRAKGWEYSLTRAWAVSPHTVVPTKQIVECAGKTVQARRPPWDLHVLSLAHYRNGEFDLAIEHAQESNAGNWRGGAKALNWLVLAMAHHRRGQTTEARTSLEQARKLAGRASPEQPPGAEWPDMAPADFLEIELLRREAADLINPKSPEKPEKDNR